MTEQYEYCGGIVGQDSGEICRWGSIPHPFVMADNPVLAQKLIAADKSLPFWVRAIAERGEFIPMRELVSLNG